MLGARVTRGRAADADPAAHGEPGRRGQPRHLRDRRRRRDLRAADAARAHGRGRGLRPSLREYSARWGVTSERVRPGQLVMHPGPMNRGVEILGEVADGPSSRIDRPGACRPGGADGRALRPAGRAGPCAMQAPRCGRCRRRRDARRAGGGVMTERLFQADAAARRASSSPAGALVDPAAGFHGEAVDVRIENGRIAEIGPDLRHADAETIDAAGLTVMPGLVDPHVHLRTPGTRTRRTSRRAPARPRPVASSPSWRCRTPRRSSTPRPCSPASSTRPAPRRSSRPGSCARSSAGQLGPQAERDGRAGRRRRGGVLRRRPARGRRRHPAPGAAVQLDDRPRARAARGGMPRCRPAGRCTRARSRPSSACTGWPSVAESTMIARDLGLARHEGVPLHICHVSVADSVAEIRRATRAGGAGVGGGDAAPSVPDRRGGARARPGRLQDEPAARVGRRSRRADRRPCRRHARLHRHRPRPAPRPREGRPVRGGALRRHRPRDGLRRGLHPPGRARPARRCRP